MKQIRAARAGKQRRSMKRIVLVLTVLFIAAVSGKAQTLTCTNSIHCVQITWAASSDAAANPGLGYKVYRLNQVCPVVPPASVAAALTTGWFLISGTTPLSGLAFIDNGFPLSPLPLGAYCYFATAVIGAAESLPNNVALAAILPAGIVISISAK